MTTKHSKGYTRIVSGRIVHVEGHDYDVHEEFKALGLHQSGHQAEPEYLSKPFKGMTTSEKVAKFIPSKESGQILADENGKTWLYTMANGHEATLQEYPDGLYVDLGWDEVAKMGLVDTGKKAPGYSEEEPEVKPALKAKDKAEPIPEKAQIDDEFSAMFGGAAQPVPETAQGGSQAAQPVPQAGLLGWKGDSKSDVHYGDTKVVFGLDTLKPIAKIYLPKTSEHGDAFIVAGLKAEWMPVAKCWKVFLGGMPQGGKNQKAAALHNFLVQKCGKPAGSTSPNGGSTLQVGATKVENGKTYILNKNHKWELAGEQQATPAKPIKTYKPGSTIDSWKQIGAQQGSNPGGLYQDANGKKWYVKFPKTGDHAKNELLAAKLYKMAGIDVPKLKLVEKGGKVGIASEWQEGLTNMKQGTLLAKQDGAKSGFVADAWLANWDAVGLGFDNMPVDNSGKAVRIDVGGSLLYRAQGEPKGHAFGGVVSELESLRDPAVNPQTAAVFGRMTQADLERSAIKVLEIPDAEIDAVISKFGPGTDVQKAELAAKLKARKAYLAKKFPKANLIANPPDPDPSKLPVKAEDLPNKGKKLDFINWNGPGKGLSTVAAVNAANQKDFDTVYAMAAKGDLTALKAYQWSEIDKSTGKVLALKPISEHKSQYFRDWMTETIDYLEGLAHPAAKKAKAWDADEVGDLQELSDAFPAHHYGISVGSVPANERLGFWISIGNALGIESLIPKKTFPTQQSDKAKGANDTTKMPSLLRSWMKSVKQYGGANQPYRDGLEVDNEGRNCRAVLEQAYAHATEFQEGTTIRKGITMKDAMLKQMLAAPEGHVFQNPGSMCCSLIPDWNWSGDSILEMVYAKGAKGLYNIGVGAWNNEGEITSLPGQRYMILKKGTENGKPKFTLLVLPPDPDYVANIPKKKGA